MLENDLRREICELNVTDLIVTNLYPIYQDLKILIWILVSYKIQDACDFIQDWVKL